MIKIRSFRGLWLFTLRECNNAILFLTALENLTNDPSGRIKSNDLVDEVHKLDPKLRVSWKIIWQLAYCGFVRISKCSYSRGTYNTMYYVYRLPKETVFSLKTIKEDVQSYLKFKEEQDANA